MSSNICRNTYINYGSYLRSRGYDQQICTLVTDLDNGLLPISGFTFSGAIVLHLQDQLQLIVIVQMMVNY